MKYQLILSIFAFFLMLSCKSSQEISVDDLERSNKALQSQVDRLKQDLLACDGQNETLTTQVENLKTQMTLSSSSMNSDMNMKDEMLNILRTLNNDLIKIIYEKDGLSVPQQEVAVQRRNKDLVQVELSRNIILRKAKTDSLNLILEKDIEQTLKRNKISFVDIENKDGAVVLSIASDYLFQTGNAEINGPAKKAIANIGIMLKTYPNYLVTIEGHTDEETIVDSSYHRDNWELSVERALSVARILQLEYGLDPKKINIAGKSYYEPKSMEKTLERRYINERTEIILSPAIQ